MINSLDGLVTWDGEIDLGSGNGLLTNGYSMQEVLMNNP